MADMWQDQAAIESNGYVMRAVGLVPINQSGRGWLRATLGEVMSKKKEYVEIVNKTTVNNKNKVYIEIS